MTDTLVAITLILLSTLGAMTLVAWTRDGGTLGGLVRWLADREDA